MQQHRIAAAALAVILSSLTSGCGRPLPKSEPFTSTARSQELLSFDATGITVDEAGRRLAWDSQRGLVALTQPGEVLLSSAISAAVIEDVVAMPQGRFGVIALNEGRILEADGKLVSRFCYLPGANLRPDEPEPTLSQLSRSIAFGAEEGRIYVQPQTFDSGRAVDTQLGQFEIGNDQPLEWQAMTELEGIAGGMAITGQQRMLIGLGARLYEFDVRNERWLRGLDLSGRVASIEGLAIDPRTNTLLVLDGPGRKVLEFDVP